MADDNKQTACDRCHKRKARCDKLQPACSSCIKAETSCVYTTRDPAIRRQDLEKLERRLRQMEAKNEALTSQLRDANYRATLNNSAGAVGAPSSSQPTSALLANGSNTNTTSSNNEVASQVSFLSLSAGGERQFLGSASGLLLASLLQADSRAKGRGAIQDEDHHNATRRFSSTVARPGTMTPDVTALPPNMLARSLVSAYLAHDHLAYPFLHAGRLLQILEAVYNDDTFYRTHPYEAFTLDMVLAIATAQVSKFDWQVMPDAETHHDRAMNRLGVVLGSGGSLDALQAILLICQYRVGSGLYDASASLWHLVGIAARMCFELGLHRESVYYSSEDGASGLDEAALERSEMKRRCFWCVVAMDRITSITLGRPLAIHLEDCDTELPRAEANIVLSPDNSLSPTEPIGSPPWQLRTAIFVHIVRYRLLCGKILSSLHNVIKSRMTASFDYENVRRQLTEELEGWRSDILSLPLGALPTESDRSSFRSREWYDLLYQNGILMLYRPSPSLHEVSLNNDTLQRIFDAAQKSISIYAYLHKSRRINYSCITLHAVFIAGLSYIYAVRSHFQNRRRQMRGSMDQQPLLACLATDPSINQIVNTTRDCSNVLVAVSERWSTARNAHQVFGRLSDALLTDVIEFQTQSRSPYTAMTPQQQYAAPMAPTMPTMNGMTTTPTMQQSFPSVASSHDLDFSYQECFDDLQNLYTSYDFGNVSMMQASQDWLFEIQSLDQSYPTHMGQ
ncbi:putative fungal-specific transcription factor [Exophiala viscosa]|uniref:Fungal-specific transcription factor n=1 Tax=Exophiala viscosa TaxID=2486360 RepID=A0AAN6DR35_9EURO|nr:putative fungal-specific transcription factor [Exophiala viscosa]